MKKMAKKEYITFYCSPTEDVFEDRINSQAQNGYVLEYAQVDEDDWLFAIMSRDIKKWWQVWK